MKSQQILAIFAALLLTGCFTLQAQSSIQRVEPPNWWAGMKNPSLQLLVYGENMSEREKKKVRKKRRKKSYYEYSHSSNPDKQKEFMEFLNKDEEVSEE
mgnify:CR=1 FL=1